MRARPKAPPRAKAIFAICLLAMAVDPGLARAQTATGNPPPPPPEEGEAGDATVKMGKIGPWGQLQYYTILLEAPASLVKLFPVPSSKTVWKFQDLTIQQIRESVIGAGLSEPQCDRLLAGTASPYKGDGVTHLFPEPELVLSLTPEVRGRVYQILRRCDGNQLHTQPYVIEGGETRQWLSGSGLRDELVVLIDRLSYPWAPGRAFSDLPLLLSHVRDAEEQDLLLKTLTRTRSLLARLIVERDADIQGLSDYWTGLGRRKDVLPILESVAETVGVHRIDVIHLLPALPRKLLYTYPDISALAKGALPDCHWTSLNFFNYDPMDRLLDYDGAMQYIAKEFEPAKGSLQFGDVLFFLHKGTEDAFHSCVFIADDIVYTKNGSNIAMPWILMRFDDLLAKYRQDFEVEIRAFRMKH